MSKITALVNPKGVQGRPQAPNKQKSTTAGK